MQIYYFHQLIIHWTQCRKMAQWAQYFWLWDNRVTINRNHLIIYEIRILIHVNNKWCHRILRPCIAAGVSKCTAFILRTYPWVVKSNSAQLKLLIKIFATINPTRQSRGHRVITWPFGSHLVLPCWTYYWYWLLFVSSHSAGRGTCTF